MKYFLLLLFLGFSSISSAQEEHLWHHKERIVRYQPTENGFKGINLKKKFNRALYGTNTGFRVEAGDQPEFAMYLPGMGGNLKLGFKIGKIQKWLTDADSVVAIYQPGEMLYDIFDKALGKGKIHLELLAYADAEGLILKINGEQLPQNLKIFASYGGVNGKKFSRDGDLGADPESVFYLKPEYCKYNQFRITGNQFQLDFPNGSQSKLDFYENNPLKDSSSEKIDSTVFFKQIYGQFPEKAEIHLSDVKWLSNLTNFLNGSPEKAPVLVSTFALTNQKSVFIALQRAKKLNQPQIEFEKAKLKIQKLTSRVQLTTPDPYLKPYGAALAIAADAIWEAPSYIHGAVAWRMHLDGWRGAYVADPLGWHDRANMHFESYAKAQYTEPLTGPVVADTALHLARQAEKKGTALFSSGYISRNPGKESSPHHYDMNLVFIDQLLSHFFYTGDTLEIKSLWPVIQCHLAWEKRNFDTDNDGLYDAYAAIWASDALQYNAGDVTHSSAYMYRSNLLAARIAQLLKQDPTPYQQEAKKIKNAINTQLWMTDLGRYAEYKETSGNHLLHPSAALWTVYHAIDSQVPDEEQAFQLVKYVDEDIPHIPIKAKGLKGNYYTISTTNWQPYTWSINNVATAEVLHTALAFWQANQPDEAFKLWKGSVLENMCLGSSPGNFGQVSFYDAMRGELYRDFADPIGMASRTLVEGLFGIHPDVINDTLTIKPGFPAEWKNASLHLPDVEFDFQQNGMTANYTIKQHYNKVQNLKLQLFAPYSKVSSVIVNGKAVSFKVLPNAVKYPMIELNLPASESYQITVSWSGSSISPREIFLISSSKYTAVDIVGMNKSSDRVPLILPDGRDSGYVFVPIKKGDLKWQLPVKFVIEKPKENRVEAKVNPKDAQQETVNLESYFNASVTDIFKNKYLSPRPNVPTLQLPWQGVGNWCYPLVTSNIDDDGFRKSLQNNRFKSPDGVEFQSPEKGKNIIYTSLWDNYPDSVKIALSGKAKHTYLVMAGSTNPMQSRLVNGYVKVNYTDGTCDTLALKNPENWWPIEQDYYTDGFAFTTGAPKPYRLYLKSGIISKTFHDYKSIKGFTDYAVDGGAATLLDMPLNPDKELKSLQLITRAQDVVIGLMAVTLIK